MNTVAITGGTGFVGKRLIDRAIAQGRHVRALARRAQEAREGVTWVTGALNRTEALDELVTGAQAVIHVAGVVNAPDRAGFIAGNIDGTRAMIAVAERAGVRRFIHVSSLSAREPDLSVYGWSKAEGERLVMASTLDWAIVRPPAIYGPGDMEMLEMFRMARRGVVPLPPPGRFSAIHVDDLARLLLVLIDSGDGQILLEPDDGREGAWTHVDFARALGRAVGQTVMPLSLPQGLLALAARAARLFQGDKAKLTPDRVAYFCHPDWAVARDRRPPSQLWQPEIATEQGLADTARWYRANGLL